MQHRDGLFTLISIEMKLVLCQHVGPNTRCANNCHNSIVIQLIMADLSQRLKQMQYPEPAKASFEEFHGMSIRELERYTLGFGKTHTSKTYAEIFENHQAYVLKFLQRFHSSNRPLHRRFLFYCKMKIERAELEGKPILLTDGIHPLASGQTGTTPSDDEWARPSTVGSDAGDSLADRLDILENKMIALESMLSQILARLKMSGSTHKVGGVLWEVQRCSNFVFAVTGSASFFWWCCLERKLAFTVVSICPSFFHLKPGVHKRTQKDIAPAAGAISLEVSAKWCSNIIHEYEKLWDDCLFVSPLHSMAFDFNIWSCHFLNVAVFSLQHHTPALLITFSVLHLQWANEFPQGIPTKARRPEVRRTHRWIQSWHTWSASLNGSLTSIVHSSIIFVWYIGFSGWTILCNVIIADLGSNPSSSHKVVQIGIWWTNTKQRLPQLRMFTVHSLVISSSVHASSFAKMQAERMAFARWLEHFPPSERPGIQILICFIPLKKSYMTMTSF